MTSFATRLLKLLGPPAKPALHRYWQIRRGMTLGVKCAAFNEERGICLVRHTYVPGWSFPGGGVDPGETIYQAAERELHEETGIVLEEPPELFGFYANRIATDRDHVALMICRNWHLEQQKQPDFEIAEAAFFQLDNLPSSTTASTHSRIAEIFNDQKIAELW